MPHCSYIKCLCKLVHVCNSTKSMILNSFVLIKTSSRLHSSLSIDGQIFFKPDKINNCYL